MQRETLQINFDMFRMSLLGVLFSVLCVFILSGCSPKTHRPPNIVIILLDDMGFSDFGFLGGEIPTPNIDWLAAQGTTYSQFYVYPRCSPTRAALLTGKHPHAVGMGFLALPEDINVPAGPYQGYLDPEVPTLADDLRSSGYKTYMSGKWHLGEAVGHWPLNYGFDRYFGLISGASSYYELLPQPGGWIRKMAKDAHPWTPPENDFYMTDAFTDQAVAYVSDHYEKHTQDPFFLYLAYTAPHFPLHAKEDGIKAFDGQYDAGWAVAIQNRYAVLQKLGIAAENLLVTDEDKQSWRDAADQAEWIRNMQIYAAMMKSVDDGIGRLLRELKEQNALDNTIILILSDNGASAEDVSSRGLNDKNIAPGLKGSYVAYGPEGARLSNTPFKDFKGTTYEGGIRSPLILYGRNIPAGTLDNKKIVSVLDIKNAVTRAIKVNNPSLPFFADGLGTDPIFWEHLGWRGVRQGKWKAVNRPNHSDWELYDIFKDPSETQNIAAEHPGIVKKIESEWMDWSAGVGAESLPMETLMKWFQPINAAQAQ